MLQNILLALIMYLCAAQSVECTQQEDTPAQRFKHDCQALHDACIEGDLSTAQQLVENTAIINTYNEYGETALHLAARFGHIYLVELLLKKNAPVNACNDDGLTPLCWAAYKGSHTIIRLLLDNDAHITLQSNNGNTPLHFAMYNNHSATLERFSHYEDILKTLLLSHRVAEWWLITSPASTSVVSLKELCLNHLVHAHLKKIPAQLHEQIKCHRLAYLKAIIRIKNKNNDTVRDVALSQNYTSTVTFIDKLLAAKTLDDLKKIGNEA